MANTKFSINRPLYTNPPQYKKKDGLATQDYPRRDFQIHNYNNVLILLITLITYLSSSAGAIGLEYTSSVMMAMVYHYISSNRIMLAIF